MVMGMFGWACLEAWGMFRIFSDFLGRTDHRSPCVELNFSAFKMFLLLFTKKNKMGWMGDMPSCCRVEL